MSEKIVGYLFLVLGMIIIGFSAVSAYLVFTKQAYPAKLFNFKGIGFDTSSIISSSLPPEFAQIVPKNKASTSQEIIPPDVLNDSSNIFAHLMLMGFLASIGYKIASLGTMLIRTLVVKVNAKE